MAIEPFATGTKLGEGLAVDTEYLVNLYAQYSDTGKSVIALVARPGLTEINNYGAFPARGVYVSGDSQTGYSLYAVHFDTLTRLQDGSPPEFIGKLTTTENPVWIGGNGRQILVTDGVNGYLHDIAGGTFVQLDSGTNGWTLTQPRWISYLSGYLIVVDAEDGSYSISGIRDGATWDATDKGFAETDPDGISAMGADNGELFLFGPASMEVHYNTGGADFPFAPKLGASSDWGTPAPFSVASFDNTIAFLGQSSRGGLRVMKLEGYQPVRISDDGIEHAIGDYETVSDAVGFAMDFGGHAFYWLTFPTAGVTWVYDGLNNVWFEARTVDGDLKRFIGQRGVGRENETLVTDYRDGRLYTFAEVEADGTIPIRIAARCRTMNDNEQWLEHNSLQVVLEHGTAAISTDPQVMLRWSDDNARTWSSEYWRDVGQIGRYSQRAKWNRLGTARNRVYEVAITDAVPKKIVGMVVNGGA